MDGMLMTNAFSVFGFEWGGKTLKNAADLG